MNSGGYILVLADPRSSFAGLRVRVSRHPGAHWLARARRLTRRGRLLPPGLKLISSHYADDPARVRAALVEALGPRFAKAGRVREGRLRRALAEALREDRVRMEARFDPATGLFRAPGDALPYPVKRLVARLAAEILARTSERRRILAEDLGRPYALGLVCPLLSARLKARGLPALYRAEAWRALARALAFRHLTDAEMEPVLAAVSDGAAGYRVGEWEYRRFARRAGHDAAPMPDRLAFFLNDPHDHMKRGLIDYRARVHGAASVQLAIWAFRVLQVAAFGAAVAGALWLLLRAENGVMPGLTLFFALGAAIPAGRLYRRPDMARLMGHVGEHDLAQLFTALEEAPLVPPAPEVADPAGTEPQEEEPAPVAETPRPVQLVDIPAPVPVTAASTAAPAAEPVPAATSRATAAAEAQPVLTAADVARAYMAMPIGPIPFPVPCMPEPPVAPREAAGGAEATAEEPSPGAAPVRNEGAEGIFVLGWGMPIPVPNWMAADAPEVPCVPAPAPSGAPARDAEAAIREARIFHATPLPPVLPSAAFWGVEGAGLQPGAEARPGAGDGPRHRDP